MGSQLIIRDARTIRVVAIVGPFDALNVADIARGLQRAAEGRQTLVVSLQQCTHVDIEAVAALTLLHRRLGAGLILASGPQRVFEITGVDKFIRIFPSVNDALRQVASEQPIART